MREWPGCSAIDPLPAEPGRVECVAERGTLRHGEGETMPWVVRDVVHDINRAVGRRWQGLDSLLPDPGDLPEGCMAPLVANGANGRPAGLGVCHHQHIPAGDRKSTRLNSSHRTISYAVFCL